MSEGESGRLIFARTPAGEPVAECVLDMADLGLLPRLEHEAAASDCALLWVHSDADLSPDGFTARPGYHRYTRDGAADPDPAADPDADVLPLLDLAAVLDLLPRAFIGQWGHHEFVADWARSPLARYAGLGQPGAWTGLCRFEPDSRQIDGPGFVADRRSPDGARRLVLSALARLGPGPVTLETWGDPPDVYLGLGFEIAQATGGWERRLR